MARNIGNKAKQGLLWLSLFNSFEFLIRFGSQIILARLLLPEDFGLMGVVTVIILFSRNTASFGFNQALVQLKEIRKEHYDTVFVFNTVLMVVVTAILFFSSSTIADFFHDKRLSPMVKVVSFDFMLSAFILLPQAALNRDMAFKKVLFANTLRNSVQLVSPIVFALLGFGVWSLVWGYMLATFVSVLAYNYFRLKLPRLNFQMSALKDIMSFSSWSFVNKNIFYLLTNVDKFIIAKWLDVTQLGFYERAFNLKKVPSRQITRKINLVLFPAYSRMQDDGEKTIQALLKVIKYVSFLSYPLMIWLFFACPSFVTVAYGMKWQPLIVPLQIMCVSGAIFPLSQAFNPVFLARGWVRQQVILQTTYLIIVVAAIFYCLQWGIIGVAYATAGSSFVLLTITAGYAKKKLSLTATHFFKAQRSPLIYGTIQFFFLSALKVIAEPAFPTTSWQMFILVSVVASTSYLGAHLLLRFTDIDDIYREFAKEAKKFGTKLPVIGNLPFFKMNNSRTF